VADKDAPAIIAALGSGSQRATLVVFPDTSAETKP